MRTDPRLSRRGAVRRLVRGLAALRIASAVSPALHALQGAAVPLPIDPRFPLPPTWDTELKEVAPGVYAYIQAGGPGRDNVSISNAGVIVGDRGVMVIDALAAPMHAARFVSAIRRVTDKPFRHLVNTHHHTDHIGGNQYFEDAEIIGHPYCRSEVLKIAATAPPLWAKRDGWAEGAEPRQVLAPTTTIEGKTTYHYGKTIVEVFPLLPAHTYGDIVVFLPQHRLLFAGDIAFYYVAPFCQNAHPSNWISICERIDAMSDVVTIVPGHGPLGGKRELADMKDYLATLKREARTRFDARMTAGAAAADIHLGRFDNWIGPERIVMDTVRFFDEFAGTLTPDVNTAGMQRATAEYNALKPPAR